MLLLRLIVTLVVCTGPWVGARCLPAGSFRVMAGLRRRFAHSLLSKTTVTAAWHITRLASHACSCKFTLLPEVARRTCDVSSKRLEHLPLASIRVTLTDGSRAPPSAWTSPCVASLVQVTPDIQPHRSVALPLLPKTTLVLWPLSLFLTLTLLPWHSMAAPRWQLLLFSLHGVVSIGVSVPVFKMRDCAG